MYGISVDSIRFKAKPGVVSDRRVLRMCLYLKKG